MFLNFIYLFKKKFFVMEIKLIYNFVLVLVYSTVILYTHTILYSFTDIEYSALCLQ